MTEVKPAPKPKPERSPKPAPRNATPPEIGGWARVVSGARFRKAVHPVSDTAAAGGVLLDFGVHEVRLGAQLALMPATELSDLPGRKYWTLSPQLGGWWATPYSLAGLSTGAAVFGVREDQDSVNTRSTAMVQVLAGPRYAPVDWLSVTMLADVGLFTQQTQILLGDQVHSTLGSTSFAIVGGFEIHP